MIPSKHGPLDAIYNEEETGSVSKQALDSEQGHRAELHIGDTMTDGAPEPDLGSAIHVTNDFPLGIDMSGTNPWEQHDWGLHLQDAHQGGFVDAYFPFQQDFGVS